MTQIKETVGKDGKKTYYFKTYLGLDPLTGKKKWTTRRGFKTKKEANTALNKILYEFDTGKLVTQTNMTYEKLYNEWIKVYAKGVIESTQARTMQNFRDHILPEIGHMRIDKITSLACQSLYNTLTSKLKKGHVVYSYAKNCFNFAIVPLRIVGKNPFDDILKTKPSKEPPKYNFLELPELRHLLECIKDQEDYKWYAYFTLLGYTGLRRSEALALNWTDLKGSNLSITKTMTRNLENKYVVGEMTKTEAGYRTIQLDENTLNVLKSWRKKQKVSSINGIMFTNSKGGYLAQPKPLQILNKVTKKNGLKDITNHDLRRTHICHLFDAGVGLKEVQARVGQKDIKTTMDIYNFVTNYRKQESITKLENYYKSDC